MTNAFHRGKERLDHLDGYDDRGGHQTWGFFDGEPDYDAIRARVVKILEGKAGNPLSSFRPRRAPDDDDEGEGEKESGGE